MSARMQRFIVDLHAFAQRGDDAALARALRSTFSGVPHDTAAAYAALAQRVRPLIEAMTATRIAVPTIERDALLQFADRARRVAAGEDPVRVFDLADEAVPTTQGASNGRTLAAANVAEPPRGVRARYGHFSASALNTYAECERKWFYRYACGAVEDAPSSASTYGTAFHAALEDFHAIYDEPSVADEAIMRTRIAGDVNGAFERYRGDFDGPLEVELQRRRAQRTAQRYITWLLDQARRAPFTVIGREAQADLELGGHTFVGYVDRVDRDRASGSVTIIDYKTGSIATSGAEYREKVRAFRDFQLPFYYWARSAMGDTVSRLALIPLKDALLDVRPVGLQVVSAASPTMRDTITIAELERARDRMIAICDDIASGELSTFAPTSDASACTYCAYVNACRNHPEPERERFGR